MAQRRNQDLTVGPPARRMLVFAVPLIAGGLLQQFFAVVDTIVVGQGVGIEALAAVGATDWVHWLFLWMVQALTQGFSVIVSQRFGAKDYAGMRKSVAMSVLLCLVFAVGFTAAALMAARPILRLLQTPENIIGSAWEYLRIIFSGLSAILAYNMCAAILRALGNSRTPFVAICIAAATNIFLDILFVSRFGWDISGVAWATVIAQLGAFLFCLIVLLRTEVLRMEKSDWRPHPKDLLVLMRMGLPMAFSNGVIAAGGMCVQYVVNGMGFLTVAGFTATNKIYGTLESTAISLGYAVTTFVAQNFGAGNATRIKIGVRNMLLVSTGISVLITLSMILWGRGLLGLFIDQSSAYAQEVLDIAFRYLMIMSALLFSLYYIHIYRPALQGLGFSRVPFLSAVAEFVMRAGVAILTLAVAREGMIFFAEVAAWIGADILLVPCYYLAVARVLPTAEADSV